MRRVSPLRGVWVRPVFLCQSVTVLECECVTICECLDSYFRSPSRGGNVTTPLRT